MERNAVPFWRKFKIAGFRCAGGWAVRVFIGFVFVSFDWKFFYELLPYEKTTGVYVGFIPWRVLEGEALPCKSWVKRETLMQEVWNG